jgi:hypothetical protein
MPRMYSNNSDDLCRAQNLTFESDPINSPLFDGSDTSMSGNGYYTNHTGVPVGPNAPPGYDIIPPDQGGGCVTTGPFAKYLFPLPTSVFHLTNDLQDDSERRTPRPLH